MRILALDISSVNIGWVFQAHDNPLCWGVVSMERLKMPYRIVKGRQCLAILMAQLRPELIAIEGAAKGLYQRAKQYDDQGKRKGPGLDALIQQQRMVGVVLEACFTGHDPIEIPPTTAKKALTGSGNADKAMMMRVAAQELGEAVVEHIADALGVLYGALGVLQERERESLVDRSSL